MGGPTPRKPIAARKEKVAHAQRKHEIKEKSKKKLRRTGGDKERDREMLFELDSTTDLVLNKVGNVFLDTSLALTSLCDLL
jgi:hypothetical protein